MYTTLIFSRRSRCQMSQPLQKCVSPNQIVDVNLHNSRLSLEGLDVRCPNHIMILKLCIRNVDDCKPDIHKYGYSLEGLDVKYPNLLWIVYHLTKWRMYHKVMHNLTVKECTHRLRVLSCKKICSLSQPRWDYNFINKLNNP